MGALILAAGGVVFNDSGRVALIHRPAYDDWCLPKGKLDKRESEMQAAVREVMEETGCIGAPQKFLGTVYYEIEGKPMLVFFWLMLCRHRRKFMANAEVDALVWMRPEVAMRRLDYVEERHVLELAMKSAPRIAVAAPVVVRKKLAKLPRRRKAARKKKKK